MVHHGVVSWKLPIWIFLGNTTKKANNKINACRFTVNSINAKIRLQDSKQNILSLDCFSFIFKSRPSLSGYKKLIFSTQKKIMQIFKREYFYSVLTIFRVLQFAVGWRQQSVLFCWFYFYFPVGLTVAVVSRNQQL